MQAARKRADFNVSVSSVAWISGKPVSGIKLVIGVKSLKTLLINSQLPKALLGVIVERGSSRKQSTDRKRFEEYLGS